MRQNEPDISNLPALHQLSRSLKHMLIWFMILLTSAVSVGLVYLYKTTQLNADGTLQHYRGDTATEESLDILVHYPKPVSELLITTHNHLFGFAFIFVILGSLFFMNSMITGIWKTLLMAEPFASVLITFGSIWGIRLVGDGFIWTAIAGAFVTYGSYYFMAGIILYELIFCSDKSM